MGSKNKKNKEERVNPNKGTQQQSVHNVNTVFIDKLKCIYTNADSLSNKMVELKTIVQIERPQLIAITEVKPKNYSDISVVDFLIKGYELHPLNIDNRVGRGILLYVHNSLKVNDVELLVEYDESCWIELSLIKSDKLLMGCIYRSDSGTQENNNKLLDIIQRAVSLKYSHYLIVGDLTIVIFRGAVGIPRSRNQAMNSNS